MQNVKAHIDNFITRTKDISDAKEIKRLTTNERRKIRRYYPVNTTYRSVISKYRKALKEAITDDILLTAFYSRMKASKSINNEIRAQYGRSIDANYDNIITVDTDAAAAAIDTAISILQDVYTDRFGREKQTPHVLTALALCILTGRRPAEVYTATFLATSGNECLFAGQLKTRDGKHVRDNYVIPVLCDAALIERKSNELKEQVSSKNWTKENTKKINNSVAKPMSQKVKEHFSMIDTKIQSKGLRKFYLAVAENIYNKNRNIDTDRFRALLLGHSEDDSSTVKSYKMYNTHGIQANDLYTDANDLTSKYLGDLEVMKQHRVEKTTKLNAINKAKEMKRRKRK